MINREHLKILVLIAESPTSKLRSQQTQEKVFFNTCTIFSWNEKFKTFWYYGNKISYYM